MASNNGSIKKPSLSKRSSAKLNDVLDEDEWVIQIRALIEEEIEEEDIRTPVSIFCVPPAMASCKPEAYVPQLFAFGPYHHWRPQLYDMERYKLGAARRTLARLGGHTFDDIVAQQFLKRDYKVRCHYHRYLDLSAETLAWMMAIDSCILLEFLQHHHAEKQAELQAQESAPAAAKTASKRMETEGIKKGFNMMIRDIAMLENQIPLFLLRKLLYLMHPTKEAAIQELTDILIEFVKELSPFMSMDESLLTMDDVTSHAHLLEVLYRSILTKSEVPPQMSDINEITYGEEKEAAGIIRGDPGLVRKMFGRVWGLMSRMGFIKQLIFSQPVKFLFKLPWKVITALPLFRLIKLPVENYLSNMLPKPKSDGDGKSADGQPPLVEEITIPSVTELVRAGVKFLPASGDLTTIEFDRSTITMYLPAISLDVNTEVVMRNLVAYEAAAMHGQLVFTRYTELMYGIIDTEEDVRILRGEGIVVNRMKSDGEAAEMWNGMSKSVRLSKVGFLFIGNWTQLQRLDMQGTSLEGPFPPTFANLTLLSQLRVSDIRGIREFPPLQNMKSMTYLVLRNLSISGQLPEYVGEMKDMYLLDLSFNNFSGPIPGSFDGLQNSMNFMFLNNNMLNGTILGWILSSRKTLDVSYNSFTGSPGPSNCQQGNVDLVSSYSSTNSEIPTCLQRNLPCSGKPKNYNLFINCGGRAVTIEGNEYEDDSSPSGAAARYYSVNSKWASSSTGSFTDNDKANYITTNASILNISNTELYTTARLSPLSLRYYGLCLQKGDYTVKLHFAEIMFTDDQTYSSVGRRLFDVSIQGQNVLHDFNISKEANGTGKTSIKSFIANVDGTLEISFYWAGKGTTSIPYRSVYGPLISAISVTPNFKPDADGKLSVGAIVDIVAGAGAVIMLISITVWVCLRRKNAKDKDNELKGVELQTSTFTLKHIRAATNNFDVANKIGEGGFGPVYKGVLPDGTAIAVKQLSSKSKQGNREFITEIGLISALQHPNLVKLHGCGIEGNQLLLIYEYMENNSLARALFGPESTRLILDWQTRRKICLGIARGLAHLHEESRLKIVHRDIKATNILLDKDLNAKISDFGLAKLDDEENTHISTRIAGTRGYMAPEYAMRGYLTDKADVYSFGVVIMEIVSGVSNTNYKPKDDFSYLLDWVYVLEEQGRLLELVDPNLGSNYSEEEALQMLKLCLACTNPSPTLRPLMSTAVSILEGEGHVQIPSTKPAALKSEECMFKSFGELSCGSQTHNISSDGPCTESAMSVQSIKEEEEEEEVAWLPSSKVLLDYTSESQSKGGSRYSSG